MKQSMKDFDILSKKVNEFQELKYNNKENENEKINNTIMSKMNIGKKIF